MSQLENFILEFNEVLLIHLKKKFNENATFELNNLCKLVSRNDKEFVPVEKENKEIVFNDKTKYQHYFRVLDGQLDNNMNTKNIYNIFDLKMIIYTQFNRFEILEFLIKNIPQIISVDSVFHIEVNNYSFDEKRIFQNERNINYNLNRFWNLIEINFKIKEILKLC